MRTIAFTLLLSSGAAFAQTPPTANTVVTFIHPEKFVDASDRGFGIPPSARVLDQLRTILVTLGAQYLGAGQSLKIDVTDVDLAGQFDPTLLPTPVRVLRDVDWPRISLHYTLTQGNEQIVRQGDERLADMNYLNSGPPLRGGEPLYYEKRMLTSWFARTFPAPAEARQ